MWDLEVPTTSYSGLTATKGLGGRFNETCAHQGKIYVKLESAKFQGFSGNTIPEEVQPPLQATVCLFTGEHLGLQNLSPRDCAEAHQYRIPWNGYAPGGRNWDCEALDTYEKTRKDQNFFWIPGAKAAYMKAGSWFQFWTTLCCCKQTHAKWRKLWILIIWISKIQAIL